MKKRVLSTVTALFLCLSLLPLPALAGEDFAASPFAVDWVSSELKNGVRTITATIYDLSTGQPAGDALIKEYKPYLVAQSFTVKNDPVHGEYYEIGEEYARVYFQSATASISIDQPGQYDITVQDDWGTLGASLLNDDSSYVASYMLDASNWEPGFVYTIDTVYQDSLTIWEDMLTGYEMSAAEAAKEDPALAEALYLLLLDTDACIAADFAGDPSFSEYLAAYENGKYADLLAYLAEFGETYVPVDPVSFDDVPAEAWYADYVMIAADMQLIEGKGDGKFAPNDNITIAEAITLAARFHSLFVGAPIDPVEGGAWYLPYVNHAQEYHLPWEYDNYNASITREEFAHIFGTLYSLNTEIFTALEVDPLNEVRDGAIPDVPADGRYADDIYLLYRLGVLGGSDEARSFKPTTNIQRSEVAAILCRLTDFDRQLFTLD